MSSGNPSFTWIAESTDCPKRHTGCNGRTDTLFGVSAFHPRPLLQANHTGRMYKRAKTMKLRCFCITCKMEGGEGRLGWSIWTGEARMASRLTLGHSSHGWRQGTCGLGHYDGMIHFICVKRLLCVWLAVCCRVNRPPCPGSEETHSHNISRCPCLQPPGVRWKSPCKHGSAFPQCKGHRGGSGVGSHSPPAALLLKGRRVPPTRGLLQHPVTWRGHGLAPRGPRFHR